MSGNDLWDARLAIEGLPPKLVRRVGLFWRKWVELDRVTQIVVENMDALTHDCIWLTLEADDKRILHISEFDLSFKSVVGQLAQRFPGVDRFSEATPRVPFAHTKMVLWVAPNKLSP